MIEFNLSDKEKLIDIMHECNLCSSRRRRLLEAVINQEKEFITKLKEAVTNILFEDEEKLILVWIDKLAGEKFK